MSIVISGDSPFDAYIVSGIKDCRTEHIKLQNISFDCETIEDAYGRVFIRRPERKTGKWIPHEDEDGEHYGDKCSECGEWYVMPYGKTNFCPNCGADMRGGQ